MLKVSEFFSVATQLAYNAAHIIHTVHSSKNMDKKWKGVDDPVTMADIKAQTYIVQQLRKNWPTLRIVGEEETQWEGQIEYGDADPTIFSPEFFRKAQNNTEVPLEYAIDKLCVWVDPLDGTLDFVKNDLDNVTTLIGVTYLNQPLFGVIGQPYTKISDDFEFKPKIYFGNAQQKKIFYVYGDPKGIPFELVKPEIKQGKMRFTTSKNRITEEIYNKIKSMDVDIVQVGGSGKKSLLLLEGNAEFYIYLGKKTSKWDICASEALLECFGGQLRGLAGQKYEYQAEEKDYSNPYGILASIYPEPIFQKYMQFTKSSL